MEAEGENIVEAGRSRNEILVVILGQGWEDIPPRLGFGECSYILRRKGDRDARFKPVPFQTCPIANPRHGHHEKPTTNLCVFHVGALPRPPMKL